MAKKIVTLTTQAGTGTTIDLNNVSYIDKVYRTEGFKELCGIKFTFHSGASKVLWYGRYESERDRDFISVSNKL
jgi:hypothetical protein